MVAPFITINNHIFSTKDIKALTWHYNQIDPARYEIYINYDSGNALCIVLETEEETRLAFKKLQDSLAAV